MMGTVVPGSKWWRMRSRTLSAVKPCTRPGQCLPPTKALREESVKHMVIPRPHPVGKRATRRPEEPENLPCPGDIGRRLHQEESLGSSEPAIIIAPGVNRDRQELFPCPAVVSCFWLVASCSARSWPA